MADNFEDRNVSQTWGSGDHSDDSIQSEVMRRINADPFLKDKNLGVVVEHGVVQIKGNLPTEMAADMLLNMVQSVPGVQDIHHDALIIGDEAAPPHPQGSFPDRGGITVDETFAAGVPVTGEEANIMSDDTVTMEHEFGERATVDENPAHMADSDNIAASLAVGMAVLDRDGHKVGKVRQVRSTDFRLERGLFSHDLYVPYESCTFEGDHVVLKVLANEVNNQGWAIPGHSDDQFTNLMP